MLRGFMSGVLVVAVLMIVRICFAATPTLKSATILDAQTMLRLPLLERLTAVEQQGPSGRAALEKVAFDPAESLQTRWRAVTVVGRAYGPEAQDFLEKSLKSSEWFMRNAAAVVIRYGARPWAIRWSRIMLNDSALVVRTAAVESLKVLGANEATDLLWEKFYDSQNYRAGHSLWIRRHILEALVQFATPDQESKFTAVLKERDHTLRPLAQRALDKIHVAKR